MNKDREESFRRLLAGRRFHTLADAYEHTFTPDERVQAGRWTAALLCSPNPEEAQAAEQFCRMVYPLAALPTLQGLHDRQPTPERAALLAEMRTVHQPLARGEWIADRVLDSPLLEACYRLGWNAEMRRRAEDELIHLLAATDFRLAWKAANWLIALEILRALPALRAFVGSGMDAATPEQRQALNGWLRLLEEKDKPSVSS